MRHLQSSIFLLVLLTISVNAQDLYRRSNDTIVRRQVTTDAVALAPVISTCTKPGSFAITFDDGPTETTDILLNYLKANNYEATFFVNGLNYRCIYDQADVIKRIVNEGHQLCSHTWSHADLVKLSDDQIRLEMTKLEDAFRKIVGKVPRYMRPPYGSYDTRVRGILASLGYEMITWDIDSGDAIGYTINKSKAVYRTSIRKEPFPTPHLALNHDVEPSTSTVLAPFAYKYVIRKGYSPQTVGSCLEDGNWYKEEVEPSPRDSSWVC
ncbi:4782_t:CDS:2 [Paraglomus occultum]|uniref:4782_t:CDS:1 n=1 Tax=Paraglomus occultum TaxID=144539 RepID=A0A9N9GGW0_9GLOM|nr:4782_t:CDS:2 [Paraglomus occultum]